MGTKLLRNTTVDLATGEILQGQLVWQARRQKSTFSKTGFTLMSNPKIAEIAALPLSGRELRVLLKVASEIDYSNFVRIEQAAMAAQIGLDPAVFSRALARLVKEGIVLRGPQRTIMLNAEYGYRGDAKNQAAINTAQRPFRVIRGGQAANPQ